MTVTPYFIVSRLFCPQKLCIFQTVNLLYLKNYALLRYKCHGFYTEIEINSQKPSDDWCIFVLDVSFIWIELQTCVHIHEHLIYRISF